MTKNKRYFKNFFYFNHGKGILYTTIIRTKQQAFCDIYMVMALVDFILYLYSLHNE